jgi:hypothetical protein
MNNDHAQQDRQGFLADTQQYRNALKLRQALDFLGKRYVLHPERKPEIRRGSHLPGVR